MNKVTYNGDSINKVLRYLAICPYHEVVELIGILQSGELVKDEGEDEQPSQHSQKTA